MASVNKVILVGNLGRDPESRFTTEGGSQITNLAIATTRAYKNQAGQRVEETEWHRVVMFGKLAEICQQYLRKGSQIYVEGRLRTRKWEKDGVTHYATEIIGETMQMLGSRSAGSSSGATSATSSMEDEFESAPRPTRTARPASPASATTSSLDDMEEDIPF